MDIREKSQVSDKDLKKRIDKEIENWENKQGGGYQK